MTSAISNGSKDMVKAAEAAAARAEAALEAEKVLEAAEEAGIVKKQKPIITKKNMKKAMKCGIAVGTVVKGLLDATSSVGCDF